MGGPYWQVIDGGSEENNTSSKWTSPFVTFLTSCLIVDVLEEEGGTVDYGKTPNKEIFLLNRFQSPENLNLRFYWAIR